MSTPSSTDLKHIFWERAKDIAAGMLSAPNAPPRPMGHTARPKDGALWFITAADTDIAAAAQSGSTAQYTLACMHSQLYATVEGTLSIEKSKEKLDEIWSPMAAMWFEDGREDDKIRLVRFAPKTAEIWATDGSARTLYEMAKAAVTDDPPSPGTHGSVRF